VTISWTRLVFHLKFKKVQYTLLNLGSYCTDEVYNNFLNLEVKVRLSSTPWMLYMIKGTNFWMGNYLAHATMVNIDIYHILLWSCCYFSEMTDNRGTQMYHNGIQQLEHKLYVSTARLQCKCIWRLIFCLFLEGNITSWKKSSWFSFHLNIHFLIWEVIVRMKCTITS
jgi:hypothetical protein